MASKWRLCEAVSDPRVTTSSTSNISREMDKTYSRVTSHDGQSSRVNLLHHPCCISSASLPMTNAGTCSEDQILKIDRHAEKL